jgi:hypothetical protein
MFPLWLVYLLIALILIIDLLLVLEVVLVGVFLIAYIAFNIVTALVGRKIDRYIQEKLDRMKLEAETKSENLGKATGHLKMVYRILYALYRIYDITSGLVVALIAIVLLTLGMAALAIVNIALLWLLNVYVI